MTDLTDEQSNIITAASASGANLMIQALAGTGKTSPLEATERAVPRSAILYLVFNKKNADEAKKKMLPTTVVQTFNGCGHRIWGACRSLTLQDGAGKVSKCRLILKDIISSAPKDYSETLWGVYHEVIAGVALAKALGYAPDANTNAKRLLTRPQFHRSLDETPDDLT